MYKKIALLCLPLICFSLSACHTNRVIGANSIDLFTEKTTTEYDKRFLVIEDDVIAFARPATPIEGLPTESVVVVGKKYSYVITQNASGFVEIFSQLNPQYITFHRDLDFQYQGDASNDLPFSGGIRFQYAPPNGLSLKEKALFAKYGVVPCDCSTQKAAEAKKVDFLFQIEGKIYPMVKNIGTLNSFSRPYQVKIYERRTVETPIAKDPLAERLALLPISLSIDVIELPFKLLFRPNQY